MDAFAYFAVAAGFAAAVSALICCSRHARGKQVSFGAGVGGALVAAAILCFLVLLHRYGADLFTSDLWSDTKRFSIVGLRFLVLGTALPCSLVGLVVVAFYRSKYRRESHAA